MALVKNFGIVLDLTESAYHEHGRQTIAIRLGPDNRHMAPDFPLLYKVLCSGQWVIEGGFPCLDPRCPETHHPAFGIKQFTGDDTIGAIVWESERMKKGKGFYG